MWTVSAVGPLGSVRAAADALDALDPPLAEAVSWFEEEFGRFRLEAYVAQLEFAAEVIALVQAAAPDLHPRTQQVPDADWVAMALDGLPPVQAGRFTVAGAHALAKAPKGGVKIWIEASQAFGTGHHGTTKGCLLALERHVRRRGRPSLVLDVGAGSGVLAIAAARLGAAADAVELDPQACAIMQENVENNGVARRVRVHQGDASVFMRPRPNRYDLVFANVLLKPLLRMASPITRVLRPGGVLILSGILRRQEPAIRMAYRGRGLVLTHRIRLEGWSTCVFEKPRRRQRIEVLPVLPKRRKRAARSFAR